jgi:hypothetical protein
MMGLAMTLDRPDAKKNKTYRDVIAVINVVQKREFVVNV